MSKIKSAKTNPGSIFPNTLPSSEDARRAFKGLRTFPCFPSQHPLGFPPPGQNQPNRQNTLYFGGITWKTSEFPDFCQILPHSDQLSGQLSPFRLRETRDLPVWSNKHPLVSLAGNSGNCWGHLRFFFFLASVPSLFIDRFVQAKPRPEDQPRQQSYSSIQLPLNK